MLVVSVVCICVLGFFRPPTINATSSSSPLSLRVFFLCNLLWVRYTHAHTWVFVDVALSVGGRTAQRERRCGTVCVCRYRQVVFIIIIITIRFYPPADPTIHPHYKYVPNNNTKAVYVLWISFVYVSFCRAVQNEPVGWYSVDKKKIIISTYTLRSVKFPDFLNIAYM